MSVGKRKCPEDGQPELGQAGGYVLHRQTRKELPVRQEVPTGRKIRLDSSIEAGKTVTAERHEKFGV